MDKQEIIRKELQYKRSDYVHFDYRESLNDKVWNYITDPAKISTHAFYPFLHFTLEESRLKIKDGKIDRTPKTRDILFAAHRDSWIYRYYGALLNNFYNLYTQRHHFSRVSIAYRNCRKGQSNIDFAEEAFYFLISHGPCYVIIGDFTHFFDYIDHDYLKKCICQVLDQELLPKDYYQVFKSVTSYSYAESSAIQKYMGLTPKELSQKKTILDPADFRKLSRSRRRTDADEFYIKKNHKSYGIPQGSPMSGVLANIYMIKYDQEIKKLVAPFDGYYRRYSDDFIILLPTGKKFTEEPFNLVKAKLGEMFRRKGKNNRTFLVKLSSEKTQIYFYTAQHTVVNLKQKDNTHSKINFLGFSFDGQSVTIRDKTVSRYYTRLYRKLRTIARHKGIIHGKRTRCGKLYRGYSIKGAFPRGQYSRKKGNFITYAVKAKGKFNRRLDAQNRTGIVPKRHMRKIRRGIDKAFSGV